LLTAFSLNLHITYNREEIIYAIPKLPAENKTKAKGRSTMSELLPRLVRFRDAPAYLGMDRNRFNREVRPTVPEIRIGIQGIAFDRLDLDAWVEQYKGCSGRPAVTNYRSLELWDAKYRPALSKEKEACGTSKRGSSDIDFEKALGLIRSSKQNGT
jgi:hypothetical protein